MKLMIVESPGKVKKIQSMLGDCWKVKASVGHVRDLPVNELAIDIDNGFRPQYVLTERGRDVVRQLRSLADQADEVYLATDLDREGEAIAWHLKVALGLKQYQRVTFAEISKAAIQQALATPRQLNMDLVAAQETRRVLDRLVGYRVSPVVGNVFNRRGLSAGRVQTPALGLVVKREIAIQTFVVTDYFDVYLLFGEQAGNPFPWCAKWDASPLLPEGQTHWTDRAFAQQVAQVQTVQVALYEAKPQNRMPYPPLITSSLQQAASVALKLSPADAMKLAQTLYEQGLITYMRTDNPNLSADAGQLARGWLSANGFAQDINPTPPRWASKDGAQEAHEAIRPVDFAIRDIGLADSDRVRLQALYDLIWTRAVASQMKPAVYDTQALALQASLHGKNLTFTARARALRYAGWMKLLPESDNEPEQDNEDERAAAGLPQNRQLPVLAPGQSIQASRGMVVACKTKPPSRYTEASLVKELESLGIGRPSTYAAILKGLLDRQYLELQKRKLHATPLGMALYDVVQPCAFAETSYTANIEERLDQIAQRKDRFLVLVSTVNQQLDSEIAALALQKRELPPDSTPPAATITRKKKASNNKTGGTQTNPKNPRNMKNTNFSGGPYHDGDPCPVCKAGKIRYKTVQSGKNAGKPMYGCTDRNCRFFAWAAQAS
jgi:DNA topoisomerase-1